MKKKLRMTTILLLALLLLIGCGKKEGNNTSTEPQTNATEESTQESTETTTENPEDSSTEYTESGETPIVKKVGNVNDAEYEKAVSGFESIVKKMRTDGLVKSSNVCVTMDDTTLKVDITFDNNDTDIILTKDPLTNVYILTFDYDFTWLEGFGPKVNDKDPAAYNKELLIATLSMISNEPTVIFDRIDLDCFSAAGLPADEWTEIADCRIMSGPMEVDKYISYTLTK